MVQTRWSSLAAWFWHTWPGRFLLAALVLLAASGLALFPTYLLRREFDRLEQAGVQRDAGRVSEAVQSELRSLAVLCKDWGVWDEAYAFVRDGNPAFIKTNLGWDSLLGSTQVQLLVILDPGGRIVWGGFHPKDAGHAVALPAFSQARIQELPLLTPPRMEGGTGLFMTPEGPLLLAAHPILHSNGQGPAGGTILMGRLLDERRLEDLSRLLAFPLSVRDTLRAPLPPGETSSWAGQGWAPLIRIRSNASLNILVAIPDLYGRERLIFTLPRPRAIHLQGQRAERFVFLSICLASLAVAGVLAAAFVQHLRTVRRSHGRLEEAVARRTAELQEAEHRFRAFIDHTHDLMFWFRLDESAGDFVLEGVNPAALRFMGKTADQVIGLRAAVCLPSSIAGPLDRHVHDCAAQAIPLILEDTVEVRERRMVFQTAFVPVPDEHGTVRLIAGSARDITALRSREEALLHTQKLESLGVLAGGIAHDFNNLLTAAQGNLDILQLLAPEDAECLPPLESVRQALAKAANLTRQMLAYSGKGRFVLQVHDLNVAVAEMTTLLEVSIGKKARLVCELAPGLPLLEADAAQVQQVIMNLVTNAADAIQNRAGTIRVRTWAEAMDAEAIARLPVHFMTPGLHVVLEVSDTGSGMPPEVQERIFEPFFSTKGTGRGLGLSAMLGILRSHRGGLALESAPGEGTTFRLWFPASTQVRPGPDLDLAAAEEPEAPPGLLLFVEDDEGIRNTTARLLREIGFPVVEARDGVEGLACFCEFGADIRLVLLDLIMPRMEGRELLAEIRKTAPTLPVVITSGYTEQELPAGDPALTFLQKPYQFSELKAVILKALHRPE